MNILVLCFMVKGSRSSIVTPLNSKEHPFCGYIPYPRAEILLNRVFAKEGDIFKGFVFNWAPVKKLILKDVLFRV